MNLTVDQLAQIIHGNPYVADWHHALERLLPDYQIDTPERIAAFLAQCAHESANFKLLRENLNYRWESLRRVFPKYFSTDEMAKQYERQPERIANRVYASRMGNGPESSGDGWRYRGRGLIQLTGKNNYQAFADSIETPLEEIPDYLETFEGATQGACWFWETNNLNRFADVRDIRSLTRAINGGYIGLEDRIRHYEHALKVLV
jgi:putative chitinase